MGGPRLSFLPGAKIEVDTAKDWYFSRSAAAASDFADEMERAVELILDGPDRWPNHLHGTRRFLLRRFPFLVVYRVLGDSVLVVAVAHAARKPGYWKRRHS